MNGPLGTRNRPWKARLSAINGESSSSISQGDPVVLNSADLGQVVLPATAGATQSHPLFAGVAATAGAAGQVVEVICAGYVNSAKWVHRTRAASTDDWSTVAARAIGNLLTLDTVNNAFNYSAAGAASLGGAQAVLLESIASMATLASSTNNSSTVSSTKVKVWVRALT